MGAAPRLPGLDGLRGLAALGVVVLHVWMWTGANDPGHPVLLDRVIGELRLGVVLFFVLSGFVLARPWLAGRTPGLGRFALRRAARIVPAAWLAMLGAFAVLHGSGHHLEVGAGQLPAFALFASNHFEATARQLDPPMWSLGVEVEFYVVLPLLGWLLLRRRAALATCGALIAAGVAFTYAGVALAWPRTVTTSLLTFLPVFACGIAGAALARRTGALGRPAALGLLAAGWLLVALNGWWHSAPHGTGVLGHTVLDLPAAAGFALIVVAVACRPPGLLSLAPLQWLGDISYGVYLWHYPVLIAWRLHDALPHTAGAALVRVVLPTLALAALSRVLVERPIQSWAATVTRRAPAGATGRVQPQPAGAGGG